MASSPFFWSFRSLQLDFGFSHKFNPYRARPSFMHYETLTQKLNSSADSQLLHLHSLNEKRRTFYILSTSEEISWQNFLSHGLVDSHVRRFIEVAKDEWGSSHIVRDVSRWNLTIYWHTFVPCDPKAWNAWPGGYLIESVYMYCGPMPWLTEHNSYLRPTKTGV